MESTLARKYFYHEINRPEQQIDLAKAALYIAQEEYPDIEVEEYLNALDAMAFEVEERLPSERYPLKIIQTINRYLYDDLGFTGNTQGYYDHRNSFLNQVIDRRTGIPITLALVYLEISKRIDFPMVGIGMPGHFLIRPEFEEVGIFVDAFNSGEILFEQDCQDRLAQMYGHSVQMHPSFLAPVSSKRFLVRMLTNLKMIYINSQQLEKALTIVERILLLFPNEAQELRDRGILYYHIGEWENALIDLKKYLAMVPNAEDASVIRRLLAQLNADNI